MVNSLSLSPSVCREEKGEAALHDTALSAVAMKEREREGGEEEHRERERTPETSNRSPTALLANSPGNSIISAPLVLRESRDR